MGTDSPKVFVYTEDYILDGNDFQSEGIDVRYLTQGSIQFDWADLDAFNARVIIQGSNNSIDWSDFGGADGGITITRATSAQIWEFTKFTTRYIRLDFTSNNVSTGSASLLFEGHRG